MGTHGLTLILTCWVHETEFNSEVSRNGGEDVSQYGAVIQNDHEQVTGFVEKSQCSKSAKVLSMLGVT